MLVAFAGGYCLYGVSMMLEKFCCGMREKEDFKFLFVNLSLRGCTNFLV